MKLGIFLPSYLIPGTQSNHGEQIRRFAGHAEQLGFDSLWITDHLLTALRFYRVGWTEPLMTLAQAAAVTSRIRLGTSILVLPTRHPVILAKEIATLQHLSAGRYVYGVGTGWFHPEFEATGSSSQERGRRTDEVLEASMQLLKAPRQSYQGRFYRFDDITIEPLGAVPPVWVAGGRQFAHDASPESNRLDRGVLNRICRWDGWIARPTATADQISLDLAEIDSELARQNTSRERKRFVVAHENFCWMTEETNRDKAIAEQRKRMLAVVSDERPWRYIESVYLTGTIEDIQDQIRARIEAGVEHIFLHTMTADLSQLDLFAKHLLEPMKQAMPGHRIS